VISTPYLYHHPREYFENIVFFILNILQAARKLGMNAVLHTSTSEVYGTAEKVPINESHPLMTQSPYSAIKIAVDKVAVRSLQILRFSSYYSTSIQYLRVKTIYKSSHSNNPNIIF
jgi:UDP-glucose 4-epimerase